MRKPAGKKAVPEPPASADAEQALLASIADAAEDAIYAGDVDGRILVWNAGAERLYGYSAAEMIGRSVAVLYPPGSEGELTGLMEAVGRGVAPTHVETIRRRKDGTTVPVAITVSPIRDASGEVIGASAIARDITEQKRAEEELRRSESRFRAIVENSHDGILFTDAAATILYRSPSYERINGYSDEERMGRSGFETVHPDDLATVRQAWADVLSHPETVFHTQYRIRHKDGWWMWIDTTIENLLTNPNVQAVVVTSRDVTRRHLAEEERGRIAQAYAELVQSARDVIFSLAPDGTVTSMNRAFEVITGIPCDRVVGRPFSELLHRDDIPLANSRLLAAIRGDPPGVVVPLRIRTADGGYRIGEIHVVPRTQNGQVVSVFGIGRDVSDRVQLEAQLHQAQKMEAIGRLAGGVAHDFNNLLTVIIGWGQLALQELEPEGSAHEEVEEMMRAAERAAELTGQLLAFSRRQVLEPRHVDLNGIVANIEKMLRRLIGENMVLVTRLAPKLGLIRADPGQVEQVITNLAVNARDAMPEGGTLTIATASAVFDEAFVQTHPGAHVGPNVKLSVRDTGAGMTEEVMSRSFEPFFTTKEPGKGTGLGLSTVYGIVKQSGGYITVESEPGRGTGFEIFFPMVVGSAAEPAASHPASGLARRGETFSSSRTTAPSGGWSSRPSAGTAIAYCPPSMVMPPFDSWSSTTSRSICSLRMSSCRG